MLQEAIKFAMRNIDNIISGVIASLLVIALQSFSIAASTIISYVVLLRFRISRLWCFPKCDRIYVISGSLEGVSPEVQSVILAGPDSDAASSVIATLGMLYPRTEVRHVYSSNFSIDFAKDNICVVGGPFNNHISAKILNVLGNKILFDENAGLIAFGKKYTPEYMTDGRCISDIGILFQMSNPLFPEARIAAFMGCDTFGVLAAALTISNRLDGRKAKRAIENRLGIKRLLRCQAYAAIVSCRVLDNDIVDISFEDIFVM